MSTRIVVTDGPFELRETETAEVVVGSAKDGYTPADLSNALDGQGTAWLCRCGASGMKPACDGAHQSCGFAGDDSDRPLHSWPSGTTAPKVTFTPGSAIEVENVDVQLQDGTVVELAGKAAVLCRCGQSTVKPGCDGTCREVGFEG